MAKKYKLLKAVAYKFSYVGIVFCECMARILPLRLLYVFARMVGVIGHFVSVKHRRIAVESLTHAFGRQKSPEEVRWIARECFISMATSAIEFFMFMQHPERTREFIQVEGRQHLEEALAQGNGVVVLSAHFGNFPLLISRLAQEDFKLHVMLRHMRDKTMDAYFERKRAEKNVGSIYTQPRQQCVRESLQALRRNEVLFMQMDQNFGTGGVFVDFFGRKAATALGPVVFSMRTGAPVVPVFICRTAGPRHKIVIAPALNVSGEGTTRERIIRSVAEFTALIERFIRRNPQEWGWIHKRWKAQPKKKA